MSWRTCCGRTMGEEYDRDGWRCDRCGRFVSHSEMYWPATGWSAEDIVPAVVLTILFAALAGSICGGAR